MLSAQTKAMLLVLGTCEPIQMALLFSYNLRYRIYYILDSHPAENLLICE